eukprot:gene29867-33711_t
MSGFIVGESLFNVALAGLIVLSGEGEPLAIANSLGEHAAMLVSLVVGAAVVTGLYRWSSNNAKRVLMRYELHRVWKVEATVKAGK